jgi:hypothetical protein
LAVVVLFPLLSVEGAAVRVSGLVTDESGAPIAGARIDHTGTLVINPPAVLNIDASPSDQRADAAGRFQVTTEAPAIVIRKPGYQSQRLRINGDENATVVLRHLQASPCKLSPPPRWKKKQANDVDYSGAWYVVNTKAGKKGIMSGSGPLYSFGAPNDNKVWTSLDYFEVMYPDGVIDARGHSSDGKYWRSKSVFGTAVQYDGMNQAATEPLDCVMDTIQVKTP